MDSLIERLPGEVQVAIYLASIIAQAIPLLLTPVRVLQWVGKKKYGTPNWITGWRIPIVAVGLLVYVFVDHYIGFNIVAFGDLLDRMDGKVAKALALLNDPQFPGFTPKGKWWDPMVDKIVVLPRLVVLSFVLHLHAIPVAISVISDVIGTLIRPPFGFGASKVRVKEQTKAKFDEASGLGKGKFLFQCFMMLASGFMFQRMFWIPELPNFFLWAVAFFSILSVLSRLKIHPKVDWVVDRVTAAFEH